MADRRPTRKPRYRVTTPRPSSSDVDNSSDSNASSLSRHGSKKRRSNQGEALFCCVECPNKDARIKTLSEHLYELRLERSDDSVIKQLRTELEDMKTRYHEMKQKYEAEKEAKDNALLRLSTIASSRLRDNNPNIADLSDMYRPTKLADIFNEIYDNEWTDAYEILEKTNMSEEEIIPFLLQVVMFVYKECKAMAEEQLNTIIKLTVAPFTEGTMSDVPDSLKDAIKVIKDQRKAGAMNTLPGVTKVILAKATFEHMELAEVQTYIQACLKLCWLAVLQDPPVVLSIDQLDCTKFNSEQYKTYTKTGPYVSYVVWPALFLCEGGGMLTKGVAQGTDDPNKFKNIFPDKMTCDDSVR